MASTLPTIRIGYVPGMISVIPRIGPSKKAALG